MASKTYNDMNEAERREWRKAENRLWTVLNRDYRGKWVAVKDHKLFESADTLDQIADKVNMSEIEFVHQIPEDPDIPWIL